MFNHNPTNVSYQAIITTWYTQDINFIKLSAEDVTSSVGNIAESSPANTLGKIDGLIMMQKDMSKDRKLEVKATKIETYKRFPIRNLKDQMM